MTWKQPWAIGGGPAIPPEVMRMVTYSNPNKGEGILNYGDLRVAQTATASGNIVVRSGGAAILNRSSGGTGQAYIARNDGDDVKAVPNVGGSARSDLVVARIIDPQYFPWETPASPLTATYIETFIVQNVPSNTTKLRQLNNGAGLGYSAVVLARIDRAAGATSVSQANIVDLREVANPRRQRFLLVKAMSSATEKMVASGTAGEQWPDHSKLGWTVDVPDWATRVRCIFTWAGVNVPANSNPTGNVWGRIGYDSDPALIDTQATQFDVISGNNNQRTTFIAADDRVVPLALRDKSVAVSMRGRYFAGQATANQIQLDAGSSMVADLEFIEAASEDA